MTELQQAMAILSQLPAHQLIESSDGRWHFVGRVAVRLAYVRKDGREPTDEDCATALRSGATLAGMTARSWPTREAALAALAEIEG